MSTPMRLPTIAHAVALHEAGQTEAAAEAYEQLLATDPRQPSLRHNLGLIRLQQRATARALPLLEQAWAEDGAHDGWLQTLPAIGTLLFDMGLWEDARRWLARAAARAPADSQLAPTLSDTLRRIQPRDYLAPEVFDLLQARTLLRHAPRESDTYVYAIGVVGNAPAAEHVPQNMPVDLFERILDKIVAERVAERPAVWLFSRGGPLLHPALGALVRAVRQRGLPCQLSTHLNVNQGLRELAQAQPDALKISVSGFMPGRCAGTPQRGDLPLVMAKLRLLRQWLDEARATTRVWVSHPLYKDGEADLPAVKALCDELGFEHHPIAADYQPLERLVDLLEDRGTPDPVLTALLEPPQVTLPRIVATRSTSHDCERRFNQTVINHDGTVALCSGVVDKPNMLGLGFIDTPQAELEAAKYRHPFCATCMKHGLSSSVRDARKLG